MIYFLIAAAVAIGLLGHFVDTAVILAVVLVNAIVGFVQEGKAERALNAIRGLVSPQAQILRENRRETVAVAEIVPGDIVLLEAGDRVPAKTECLAPGIPPARPAAVPGARSELRSR